MEITPLVEKISSWPAADIAFVKRAYAVAADAHAGQTRYSGEPYITHPLAAAMTLADLKADKETIAAALLHDTLEDTTLTAAAIEREFGPTVRALVEGVTKLGHYKYHGLERHVESLRKLFIATAADIRVIMIRLADRLHNVETLAAVPEEKRRRIALETLEIYAPIASRLGMWHLKSQLEDGAFPHADPRAYRTTVAIRKREAKRAVKKLEKIYRTLETELAAKGITATVSYRVKYLYSLYLKLRRRETDDERIYDVSALRIIVPSVEECYRALGVVHQLWRPVPGRLKDYIANPKPNGYQSIHTSIWIGDGEVAEVQIRTTVMHEEAEYGIAAYTFYDATRQKHTRPTPRPKWIDRLLAWQKETDRPDEYLQELKDDFCNETIFVFTPKSDVVELPVGSTAIDFAYAIHSDLGDHIAAVRVNGKFVALATELHGNDIVDIETNPDQRPSRKWLEIVKTNFARKKIRAALGLVTPKRRATRKS